MGQIPRNCFDKARLLHIDLQTPSSPTECQTLLQTRIEHLPRPSHNYAGATRHTHYNITVPKYNLNSSTIWHVDEFSVTCTGLYPCGHGR
eukprot:6473840-Amphidinium_carterae.1